ncbi:cyclin-T-like isoform X2 [Anneissia japonica]|nr:cyclin-T-like isoform X2 [Anneissia japonica]
MQIPKSSDGKNFWEYVDRNMTLQLLDDITREFIQIIEKCPSRLKRKLTLKAQAETDTKHKVNENASTSSSSSSMSVLEESPIKTESVPSQNTRDQTDGDKTTAPVGSSKQSLKLNEYKMMKEKETKREKEKARQRESQKIDDQSSKYTNHNRLLEKPKDVSGRQISDHPIKHSDSKSFDGHGKPREGHGSVGRVPEHVKHGDHKWSNLSTESADKLSDTSPQVAHRSQGHGDAHRTHDRSRAHHVNKQQGHPSTHSDRTLQSSAKPSSKDVRAQDHKKDIRHRHYHPDKRPISDHKVSRPVEEPRLHTSEQRHRTEQRQQEGSGKIFLQKLQNVQDSVADIKMLGSEQKEAVSMKEKTKQDYILMKPDSLVEMDILGALQEECANVDKPSPARTTQLDFKSALSKEMKDRFKREVNTERVPDHQSLLQESMQGISKKEPISQQNIAKDKKRKSGEQYQESRISKVKPEQSRVKPESPRLRKEFTKIQQDSVKSKSEHPASPVKVRRDVHQSPVKVKKPFPSKTAIQETSTLDVSSIGIGNFSTNQEHINRDQHKEKHKNSDLLSPSKVKRAQTSRTSPAVKKETPIKLDFHRPVFQKVKSEPTITPVAPPKKRIKNMMQSQSQPSDFDVQSISVPKAGPEQIPQPILQPIPQPPLRQIPQPGPQPVPQLAQQAVLQQTPQPIPQPALQPISQPALQQISQLTKQHTQQPVQQHVLPAQQQIPPFSNPVLEPWSDMMHPTEILDASDFMNDMNHDMSHLEEFSLGTGLLPGNLFDDFQETDTSNSVQMNASSNNILEKQELIPPVESVPSVKKKLVQKVPLEVKQVDVSKVIAEEVHPAEVLDKVDKQRYPSRKSKVEKHALVPATNELEFEPHPAELFLNKSVPAHVSPAVEEPAEEGELTEDEQSVVHPTEIENPVLLRVKNEEPVILKERSSDRDQDRRSSDHRQSDQKHRSSHKHSSQKKKKDKDRDRHRSKDRRSSSHNREVKEHSSESREVRHQNANGNGAGPSVQDDQPTSVLTTSGGIKLKIKLGNSFSEKQASPSAGSSPLSMKIDLKKIQSSKRDYDSKHDKEKRKDKSMRHHKHKSHKRSHSPMESSTIDTPSSPAKRRAINSTHNSLLSLPMPPADPKKKSKHSLNNSNGDSPASNVYNFN